MDDAEKLALATAGDKMFRGESAGKALILLGKIYREQAEKATGADAKLELLKKAYGTYNRVYVAYQEHSRKSAPKPIGRPMKPLIEMGDKQLADETLKALTANRNSKTPRAAKKGRRNCAN